MSPMTNKNYCFVVPRFFEGLAGGAETLLGSLAKQLAARGAQVELLATCARDNRTWENEFPPGESSLDGVRLIRFPVDARDLSRWVPIQCAIHDGKRVSFEEQLTWMQESVNSSEMYRYIARYGCAFDAIFFGPYLFGTTFWGSQIHPQRSVLVPCLHDESYAYLDLIAAMFRGVRGCLFNSVPEMELARSIYGDIKGGVVGMSFDSISTTEVESLNSYLDDSAPYILYLGRKEMGKNAHLLIDFFSEIKDLGLVDPKLKLVILGGGSFSDLHRDCALSRGDIVDLPHLSEIDKRRLLKNALMLCQPSVNESFSIVLMEAWIMGAPVAVHGDCAVTKHHVDESRGGLYISTPGDLAGVVKFFMEDATRRAEWAERGRAYVEREFSEEAVIGRFNCVVEELFRGNELFQGEGECVSYPERQVRG
jgi:glycosyltransferase involved in cell wall biosynthesis